LSHADSVSAATRADTPDQGCTHGAGTEVGIRHTVGGDMAEIENASGGDVGRPFVGSDVAIGVVAWLVGLFVLAPAAALLGVALTPHSDALPLALQVVGLWSALVGACVLVARQRGRPLRDVYGFALRPVDIPTALGVLVADEIVVVLIGLAVRSVAGGHPSGNGALLTDAHGVTLVVALVTAIVGAPIVEELFFRGLLLRALGAVGPAWTAVAGQALLFGVSHVRPDASLASNVLVMLSTAAIGVIHGLVALRVGRLGPTILGHAALNGVAAALLLA
jgi:membrane protease YdiL (CAAX protease family)